MNFLDRLLYKAPPVPKEDAAPPISRADQWYNAYSGFGTSRDRAMATYFAQDTLLTTTELDALFYGSDIAAKIVEFKPGEMMRRGYEIRIDDEEDSSIPDDLLARARELDLDAKLLDAMVWGRLYGGCLVILGLNDGQEVTQPLKEEGIRSLDYIHVIDRRYALALTYYQDPLHPKFGMPETYQVGDPMFGNWATVHESRCLRFEGVRVDARRRRSNAGWGNSVLQRPYESVRDFSTAFQAVGFMLADASQGVFKMKGLIAMIAGNRINDLNTRAALLDMSRSVARSVMLDADGGEEFTKVATQFAGVSDMLDRSANKLSADSSIPVTVLMGKSPAGLNATGESDIRIFYDTLRTAQKNDVGPQLQRVINIIQACRRSTTPVALTFPPLWQQTDLEKATIRKLVADTDKINIDSEVITPEEVRASRFTADGWSFETNQNPSLQMAHAQAELARAKAQAAQMVPPAPVP